MASVNWAAPVFGNDVQTSAAYLQRLQDFLAMQQPGGDKQQGKKGDVAKENNKRKVHPDEGTGNRQDTTTSIKDRRQSMEIEDRGTHSHERSTSPPETASGKPKGKGTTSEKRKEQNRNAQRAFRERKEKVLKDLEDKIEGLNKVNQDQQAENQNLKELVTRLQEENKRLQQQGTPTTTSTISAPQSDFTFNLANSSSSNGFDSNLFPGLPSSLNDQDLLSFLGSKQSDAEIQQYRSTVEPFQFIDPPESSHQQQQDLQMLIPSTMPTLPDDWLWNASSFGTEIPQAIPPHVTNLLEKFGGSDLNTTSPTTSNVSSPQNDIRSISPTSNSNLFGGSSSDASILLNQGAGSPYQALLGNAGQNSVFNSSLPQVSNPKEMVEKCTNPDHKQQRASSTGGSNVPPGNNLTNTLVKQLVNREAGLNSNATSTVGDSPETTCSSSGSDPSDQPATPSSNPFSFTASNNKYGFPYHQSQLSGNSLSSGTEATTPSSVLNSLNYLTDHQNFNGSGIGNVNLDFQTLLNGNSLTLSPNDNKGELMDFSEFFVASPAAANSASPGTFNHDSASSVLRSNETDNGASSTSSVPTLSSVSTPSDSASPQVLNGFGKPNKYDPFALPSDIKYSNPLVKHVMSPVWSEMAAADPNTQFPWMAKPPQQGQPPKRTTSSNSKSPQDPEIESLCSDMAMKASCQEIARERIALAMQTDKTALKLYDEYVKKAKADAGIPFSQEDLEALTRAEAE